ncbi:MAG: RagB/SusD family nutrient uptake outer membrane protein [Puia sp.]|nr:RagB/SusD family nutrient uptake outer membrane protein [Puia sp.]
MKKRYSYILVLITLIAAAGCKKDFLDAKPQATQVVPSTVADLQALLDNPVAINIDQPTEGELSSDDYYLTPDNYNQITPLEQFSYTWATDVFNGSPSVGDWDIPYQNLLLINLALEGAVKIGSTPANATALNNVIGSAHFYRGWEFYLLAQTFSKQYDSATAATDLGIPLKMSADVNDKVGRSSVQQTYDQILSDIKTSLPLLPSTPANNKAFRPSQAAAYGLLARIYLSLGDYTNCLANADSCLAINSSLLSYSQLDSSQTYPMPYPNSEIIFDYTLITYYGLNYLSYTDSTLYNGYAANDLRKPLYFNPYDGTGYSFRGWYYNQPTCQGGLCTDEMILTKAECEARLGETNMAMNDLNNLLQTRWAANTYVPYTASNSLDALTIILNERRKELAFRGTRWIDLRRLNRDTRFALTLTRNMNNQVYTLPPNDPRYVFPIPQDEILYNPTMPQNTR